MSDTQNLDQFVNDFNNLKSVAILGYPKVGKHTVEGYLKSPGLGFCHKKMKIKCSGLSGCCFGP